VISVPNDGIENLDAARHFVEELALIDQPNSSAHRPYVQLDEEQKERVFGGILRLSQKEAKGLAASAST